MNGAGKALLGVGIAVLVVAILVGGYLGGWWLKKDITQREAGIREDTFARQTALADEVYTLYADVTRIDVQLLDATKGQRPPLEAQRVAFVERMCDAYGRLNGTVAVAASAESFAREEC